MFHVKRRAAPAHPQSPRIHAVNVMARGDRSDRAMALQDAAHSANGTVAFDSCDVCRRRAAKSPIECARLTGSRREDRVGESSHGDFWRRARWSRISFLPDTGICKIQRRPASSSRPFGDTCRAQRWWRSVPGRSRHRGRRFTVGSDRRGELRCSCPEPDRHRQHHRAGGVVESSHGMGRSRTRFSTLHAKETSSTELERPANPDRFT